VFCCAFLGGGVKGLSAKDIHKEMDGVLILDDPRHLHMDGSFVSTLRELYRANGNWEDY
jgi:hypothetical protein